MHPIVVRGVSRFLTVAALTLGAAVTHDFWEPPAEPDEEEEQNGPARERRGRSPRHR